MKQQLKAQMEIMKQVNDAIREPYVWPGGYEKFGICIDGGTLCPECLKSELSDVAHDTLKGWETSWNIAGVGCACNYDGPLNCDHCNKVIVEE